jgi:hypothetical protein
MLWILESWVIENKMRHLQLLKKPQPKVIEPKQPKPTEPLTHASFVFYRNAVQFDVKKNSINTVNYFIPELYITYFTITDVSKKFFKYFDEHIDECEDIYICECQYLIPEPDVIEPGTHLSYNAKAKELEIGFIHYKKVSLKE